MTFRRRFIVLFFLISLIPIALVQVYTFVFYVPSISAKVKALIDYNLEQKGQNVRLLVGQDVDIIYQMAGDSGVSDTIRALATSDPGTLALRESQLIESFSQFSLFRDSLAGIGYLGTDGRLVEYDKYLMARDAEEFNQFFPLNKITEAVDRNGGLQFFPTTIFRDRAGLPKNLFLVAFPFVDVARHVKSGYLFLLLKEDSIREILNPSRIESTGVLTRSFLFDDHGAVYSAPADQFIKARVSQVSGSYDLGLLAQRLPEFRGRAVKTFIKPGPFPGWLLGTIYDESSVFADRDLIAVYTILLGLFFLVLSGAVSAWAYRNLFRSFSDLMESLRVEDSRLNLRSEGRPRDEIEILGTAWTRMKDRITELVGEVNARNASLLSVAEERRLAEIRALEAQVNPHFLYNTLNTLNWLAIKAGQDVLSQALSDLAEIMRYSISQIDHVATLGDEKVWLEKYLSLQQLRFGKSLEYTINDRGVDPNFRLYKLLVQPFVENSLIHGFDWKRPARLEILFESAGSGRLRTTIRDNGQGFDVEQTRAKILQSSIGILNVEKRLSSYYGQDAFLTYTSTPGQGTVVILEIPRGAPMKILVVEDEPEPREGLCELLRKTSRDWEVLPPSASGAEGLLAVESLHPDLVITDIRMPELDGLQMVGAFRRAGNHPKVIVLSGYPDFEYARKCLSLGVSEYLLKPSTAAAVIEAVRTVENDHWSDAELRDCLTGKTTLDGPGVLFLFQSSQALTIDHKKALRREIGALTGNPAGTLVSEFPSHQIFFFARRVLELPPATGGLLETLKHRLPSDLVGGALMVSGLGASSGDTLRKALKRFLMTPSPGFLWGIEKPQERLSSVAYPFALEKELVALLGSSAPGSAARLLDRLCTDIFRAGFDPEDSVRVTQKLFSSIQKRIEALDAAKFSAFQTLAPAGLLETVLDHQGVVKIFAEVGAVFDLCLPQNEPKADHLKVQSALTLIEKRLGSPPTLAECAAELGMSPEYLSRLFKSQMATGYSKYVMGRRIDLAKGLIASSRATIQQISTSLGFQNAKYFCAIFRKETGLTPSEYRSRFV